MAPATISAKWGSFANQYNSRAVATQDTVLYRVDAATLRKALDQNPALQEELLHEKRAGRLRRIPLLHSLTDDQLRWLAQIVQERNFAKGERLPLTSDAGLWIVDYGQISVTGPANPHEDWEKWGVTAGNFFFSPSPDLQFGRKCIADTAVTTLPSRLFYIPVGATNRLIATFPAMGDIVAKPIDIAEDLVERRAIQCLPDRTPARTPRPICGMGIRARRTERDDARVRRAQLRLCAQRRSRRHGGG